MKKYLAVLTFLYVCDLLAVIGLNGKFDWNGINVKTLCPAVKYAKIERTEPRMLKIAVLKVDLTDPALQFQMTPRSAAWGKPMPGFPKLTIRTDRKTCRKFMEEMVSRGNNVVACVNASPWTPWRMPWNHPHADRLGLLIDNGVPVSPPLRKRAFFYIGKDNSYGFGVAEPDMDISPYKHAISGFAHVLKEGKVLKHSNKGLAPRTGYGLSADRKTMYIAVVDGRQPGFSMGTSREETGELLLWLGADEGLNMDGGGSTTLLIRDGNGKITKLNHYINDLERAVGGAICIIYRKN